jgi:hypothetical protein
MNNALQFAVVQPVEGTPLAILDDDVAPSTIRMGIHYLAALRALDSPIHLSPIRLMGRFA